MRSARRSAAITGAGSGIGREIAVQLARGNWNIHLADSDRTSVLETQRRCIELSSAVTSTVLDVSNREQVQGWASSIDTEVDAIFNVAGVLYSGNVADTPLKDLEWVMNVNFWGAVNGTAAFLPQVLQSDRGRIVNVSSAFGIMAAPGYSAYNASKFAVRGFTEALSQELRATGSTARATCVIPGGVRTPIAQTARAAPGVDGEQVSELFDKHIARTDPRDAARKIISGVNKGKPRVLIGHDAHLVDLVVRLSGSSYLRLFPLLRSVRR